MMLSGLPVCGDELIYALGVREEILTPTFQPTSQVAWDSSGDGNEELMAYDSASGRLVVMETKPYEPGGDLGLDVGILRAFSSGLGFSGTIFSTDTNNDGENDLVLLSDTAVRIWDGGVIRSDNVEQSPDREFQFAASDFGSPLWLAPTDLDGDGSPEFVFGYESAFEAGILTDFDEAEPRVLFLPTVVNGSGIGSGNPQIVNDWDGAGLKVVARDTLLGTTEVHSFDSELNPVFVEEVLTTGIFAHLRNGGRPELLSVGFSLGASTDLNAIIYEKIGDQWIPEFLEEPSEPINFGANNFRPFEFGKLSEGNSGRESVFFARPGGAGDYYRIKPSIENEVPSLVIEQGDATFPPADFHPLRLPNRSTEVLAIQSFRTQSTDVFGTPVGRRMLSLRRPDSQGVLTDIFSLVGSVGQSTYADVDGVGTPDLISLRRGDSGVSVYFQASDAALSETVTYPANDTTPAEQLVKGNFSGNGLVEFAISGGSETSGIPVYRLTPTALTKTGGTLPTRALGSGDFTGNGADELLFLDEIDETLRYASFDSTGARNGGDVIALAGRTPPSGFGLTGPVGDEGFVKPRQVLVVDADGDGDDDILTYPSALGQRIALHRSYGGIFSLEPLSGLLGFTLFGPAPVEDGILVPTPTHLLAGKFLQGGGQSLVTYGRSFDIFGNSTFSLTTWSGSLDNPTALANSPAPVLESIAVADLDGDGLDDIIATGGRTFDIFGNELLDSSLSYLRSKGDGTFEDPVSLADPDVLVSQIMVQDVDLDGIPDVTAVIEENNSIVFYRGRRIPAYPAFAEWATEHSPENPSLLDRTEGGEPNLILFARGEVPSISSGIRPPTAPVIPSASWDGTTLSATHPIPRLGNGDSVDVILQYSYDLVGWSDVDEGRAFYSQDPAAPQWQIKQWQQVYPSVFGSEEIFHRFRVDYTSN